MYLRGGSGLLGIWPYAAPGPTTVLIPMTHLFKSSYLNPMHRFARSALILIPHKSVYGLLHINFEYSQT